jgi:hypothetical protein
MLLPSHAKSPPTTSRSKQLIIGLLVCVLCCQCYIMRSWFGVGGGIVGSNDLQVSQSTVARSVRCGVGLDARAPPSLESAQIAMQVLKKYLSASTLAPPFAQPPPSSVPVARAFNAYAHDGAHVILGAHKHHAAANHRDDIIHAHENGEHAHSSDFLSAHRTLYSALRLNFSLQWAHDQLNPLVHHSLSVADQDRMHTCMEWWHTYHVEIEVGWGGLPKELYAAFDELGCSEVISLHQTARFIQNHTHLYDRVWAVDPNRDIPVPTAPNTYAQVIAIVVAITTRGLKPKKIVDDLVLFKSLFPSLLDTIEPGFEYWFYLGYDKGDPVLDQAENLALIREWFDAHMTAVALTRSIVLKLVFASWSNPWNKPGPAFNYVCGVAHADGAEFVYRINDDQVFQTPWAKSMTTALREMGPPYGVVGPTCKQGAQSILIVDFVHRTHYDIFPTHYPPSLMAWWMDNWVSNVYGQQRTKRLPDVSITHLLDSHGTRYVGMFEIAQFLRGEKIRSKQLVELYLAHTPGMEQQLAAYRIDAARGKYEV